MTGRRVGDDDWEETASVARGYSVSPGISIRGSGSGLGFCRSTRRLLSWRPEWQIQKADQLTGDIQSALACRRRSTWIR